MNGARNQESLLDRLTDLIGSGDLDLPVFSRTALRLQSMEADGGEVDPAEIERMILDDQVLVAEVLRAANSPYFGGLSQVQTVRTAIIRLGLAEVARLSLAASHREVFATAVPELRDHMESLWTHAHATSLAGRWLAKRLGYGLQIEEQAFLGGLLHDVGKLVILRAIGELRRRDDWAGALPPQLLTEVIDTAHAALGDAFLKRWDIPEVYCEIARDHHIRELDPSRIPVVLVRLANMATAKTGLSLCPDPSVILSALPEAQVVNAQEVLMAELEIMLEDTVGCGGHRE